jgi:hypothetical protein
MHRATISALILGPLLVVATGANAAPQVIHLSLYAPAQSAPPVRIVGFEHDESEIRFVFSNETDRLVVGVVVGRVNIAPSGCAVEPRRGDMAFMSVGGAGFELRVTPHGRAIASRAGIFSGEDVLPRSASYPHLTGVTPQDASYPHFPKSIVFSARDAGAAYMQVQFGVTGVYFEDGSTWPAQVSPGSNPSDPFNSELVEAEAGKCSDVPAVASALRSVKEVVFEHESAEGSNSDDNESVLPYLRFSCSLEGPKAVCRLPLEKAKAHDTSN